MTHNSGDMLLRFSRGLLSLREVFHQFGRIEDSNLKLDEIVKILAVGVLPFYHPRAGFTTLRDILSQARLPRRRSIVDDLNEALSIAANHQMFTNSDGTSLLGVKPSLILTNDEEEIVRRLVVLIAEMLDDAMGSASDLSRFEFLNESFGHFVRDNFRNNIEDAQYMTPIEVVTYICEMAIDALRKQAKKRGDTLQICDPSCGVGTFLAQFYKVVMHDGELSKCDIRLIGQDKVDRMARLARLNMILFNAVGASITRGNSLIGESALTEHESACDLIITNPPFGARFETATLRQNLSRFPLLADVIKSTDSVVDSELAFVDRYVSLLKPGGTAFVVLPDGVVSARGMPEILRDRLSSQCTIHSLTELPPVTFAQAGTRTRTCVLHFSRRAPQSNHRVFVAIANDLGFEVKSRKGVPIKVQSGTNDLIALASAYHEYCRHSDTAGSGVISDVPSAIGVDWGTISREGWTPGHYSSSRFKALMTLSHISNSRECDVCSLSDLVTVTGKSKRSLKASSGAKCISVLHLGAYGYIDIHEVMHYQPKYPGQPCEAGDLIFSKINPRIPRATVVPDLGMQVSCSSEFEVLRSRGELSEYAIAMLLLSQYVQAQIASLTCGTSSSHNRIKTEQLMSVKLPVPRKGSHSRQLFDEAVMRYEQALKAMHNAASATNKSMETIDGLFD